MKKIISNIFLTLLICTTLIFLVSCGNLDNTVATDTTPTYKITFKWEDNNESYEKVVTIHEETPIRVTQVPYVKPIYGFVRYWAIEGDAEKTQVDVFAIRTNTTLINCQKVQEATVSFISNGGSDVSPIDTCAVGESLSSYKPANPVRAGYTFVGWYLESSLTNEFNWSSTLSNEGYELYAKWSANTNTPYTIKYFFEDLSGNFVEDESLRANLNGTSDATIGIYPTAVAGFSASNSDFKIPADGSGICNVQYRRNTYTVTYKVDGNVFDTVTYKYDAPIQAKQAPDKEGFNFTGWNPVLPTNMPNENLEVSANYGVSVSVGYVVRHLFEKVDGTYEIKQVIPYNNGTTGETVTAEVLSSHNGYTVIEATRSGVVLANGSLIIEVKYERTQYSITFDSDGGTNVETITLKYLSTVTPPANPTKQGYVFDKWDKTIPETMPIDGFAVKAVWKPATDTKYVVKHYTEKVDGTYELYSTDNSLFGTTNTNTNASSITIEHFTFNSTHVNNKTVDTIKSDGSTVLSFYYTRNEYNVSVNTLGGSVVGSYKVKYGAQVPSPTTNPTKQGYNYGGLDATTVPTTMPGNDITVKVVWTPKTDTSYKVIYYVQKNNDLTAYDEKETENLTGTTDSLVSAEIKTYTGYTHKTEGVEASQGNVKPDGTLVLRVYYTLNEYEITFNFVHSFEPEEYTYKYNDTNIITPIVGITGYEFVKWVGTGAYLTVPTNMPAQNLFFTAQYNLINYSITYTLNDGQAGVNAPASYNIESNGVTLVNPTRNGYNFLGWFDNSAFTGSSVTTIAAGSYGNKAFYAKWEAISYNITYTLNEGTAGANTPETYNISQTPVTLVNPTRNGYNFLGWFDNSAFTGSAVTAIPADSTGNKAYYAKWELATYTINYELNGTSWPTEIELPTSPKTTANTTAKSGYWTGYATNVYLMASSEYKFALRVGLKFDSNSQMYKVTQILESGVAGGLTESYDYAIVISEENSAPYNELKGKAAVGQYVKVVTGTVESGVATLAFYDPNTVIIPINHDSDTYTINDQPLVLPEPTLTNHEFMGWCLKSDLSDTPIKDIPVGTTGNLILYAKWIRTIYNISYNKNGGTWPTEIELPITPKTTVNTTANSGYWSGYATNVYLMTTTAYQWSLRVGLKFDSNTQMYKVTEVLQSGVAGGLTESYDYGIVISGDNPIPFSELKTNVAVGQYVKVVSGTVESGVTTLNFYDPSTVTIPSNKDSEPYNINNLPMTLPEPRLTNYVFIGWCTKADLSDTPILSIPDGTTGDLTLYAKYGKHVTYSYTFTSKQELLTAFLFDFYTFLLDKNVFTTDTMSFTDFAAYDNNFVGKWYSYTNTPGDPTANLLFDAAGISIIKNYFQTFNANDNAEDYFMNSTKYYTKWKALGYWINRNIGADTRFWKNAYGMYELVRWATNDAGTKYGVSFDASIFMSQLALDLLYSNDSSNAVLPDMYILSERSTVGWKDGSGNLITELPVNNPIDIDLTLNKHESISIAEFLSRKDTDTFYILTGVVKNIVSDGYGNFTLVDSTGSIYVYGVREIFNLPTTNTQWTNLGVNEYDTVTICGKYLYYNDTTHEVTDAFYISHTVKVWDDAAKVEVDKEAISVASPVVSDFILPLVGSIKGCTISWSSNNDAIVVNGANATVTRQIDDTTVTLTATITSGSVSDTRNVEVIVNKLNPNNAGNYKYTFANSEVLGTASSPNTTTKLGDLNWNVNVGSGLGYLGYNGTKGVQIGSSSNPCLSFTLSTNQIDGKVAFVIINASIGSSGTAKLVVKVNGVIVGEQVSLTTTATDYKFILPAAVNGTLSIEFTNTVKAFYIKSIEINPVTSSVLFDSNTGSGTMNPVTNLPNTTVKIPACSFTKTNYDFASWNTQSDGTGTKYEVNDNYELTDTNLTLYAIWTYIKPALTAPTISLIDKVVSWSAIENAVKYEIYDGTDKLGETTNLNYTLNISVYREHPITVIAVADNINYKNSASSNSIVYTMPLDTPEHIVEAAYALEAGNSLTQTLTLTGVVSAIGTAYSTQYDNITLTIIVAGLTEKPIVCYRLAGEYGKYVKVNDTITVSGTLKNYYGTIEFDTGCVYVLSDAQKVVMDKETLEVTTPVTTDFTLPTAGANGSVITWAIKEGTAIALNGAAATVTRPAAGQADATVILTATITVNEANDTKDITIVVKAEGAISIPEKKTYLISDFPAGVQYAKNEVHKLDENVTLYTNDCHFTTQLRIYSSSANDGYVVSNELPANISELGFNIGNKIDFLNIFGSNDGSNWELVGTIEVTTTAYSDKSLSFGDKTFKYFKLDVKGTNQLRITSITITYK